MKDASSAVSRAVTAPLDGRSDGPAALAKAQATAYVDGHVVAEAELLLVVHVGAADVDPSAHISPGAEIGDGTVIGPNCVIGPAVRIGRRCRIGASVVIDGRTEIGDDTQIYPMASIGMAPQDLKYKGEDTRLTIGRRNIILALAKVSGALPAGRHTTMGDDIDDGLRHVRPTTALGKTRFSARTDARRHVEARTRPRQARRSPQFCRVGRHGFIGATRRTKDAIPFGSTIGSRPARISASPLGCSAAASRPTRCRSSRASAIAVVEAEPTRGGADRAGRDASAPRSINWSTSSALAAGRDHAATDRRAERWWRMNRHSLRQCPSV